MSNQCFPDTVASKIEQRPVCLFDFSYLSFVFCSQTSQTESLRAEEWDMNQENLKLWVQFGLSSLLQRCSVFRIMPLLCFICLLAMCFLMRSLRWCCFMIIFCRIRFTLPLCNIYTVSLFSLHCLAWRGLWSKGDSPAEVSAPAERDPGTHSGGGCHPGELTARHTLFRHTCFFSCFFC